MMDYAILLLYLIDIREQVCHTDSHHGNSAHLPNPTIPLTDLMGTINDEGVRQTSQGCAMPNMGKSSCCCDTCQPQ